MPLTMKQALDAIKAHAATKYAACCNGAALPDLVAQKIATVVIRMDIKGRLEQRDVEDATGLFSRMIERAAEFAKADRRAQPNASNLVEAMAAVGLDIWLL